MPRKKLHKKNQRVAPPIMNPNAAGIDIGATEIYVAVPADRDPEPIRMFATFTQDANRLADWLQQCGVRTVAMGVHRSLLGSVDGYPGIARAGGLSGQRETR